MNKQFEPICSKLWTRFPFESRQVRPRFSQILISEIDTLSSHYLLHMNMHIICAYIRNQSISLLCPFANCGKVVIGNLGKALIRNKCWHESCMEKRFSMGCNVAQQHASLNFCCRRFNAKFQIPLQCYSVTLKTFYVTENNWSIHSYFALSWWQKKFNIFVYIFDCTTSVNSRLKNLFANYEIISQSSLLPPPTMLFHAHR